MTKQRTLKDSFTLEGKGLHTGLKIKVRFCPAPDNFGYKIKRVDLEGEPVLDAVAENVAGTNRGTVISKNGIQISTIEHGMAALYAMGVDNCLIEVDAPEFPILDGSAIRYVEEIQRVGTIEQNEPIDYFVIKNKIEVKDETTGSSLLVLPDNDFCINALVSYDSTILDNQYATMENISEFASEIAACRTFVFVREVEPLLQNDLIKGGDLDNAIVIYERQIDQEHFDKLADTMGVPHKDATQLGYINNKPLAYPNEPARHKLLDIIGDIALIGRRLKGRIIATRPGHKINNQLARLIRKEIKQSEVQAPLYDPNVAPLMDLKQIKELLPHRYPFLLVDKIIEKSNRHVVGLKNVTNTENFFQGHFPEEPVMPGVLLIEAMAQTGGILALSTVDEPKRYSTYFLKMDNVKFRNKVVPGDTVIFHLSLMDEIRRGIVSMKGFAFVGEKIACEAELMAQIVKNK
ncbi:MAG: bifunctional UDP-3-O-[3-hydroxymyristoyl] N-acetylglucosamine deacetylase/3-hydroxyacyl-ACP dehydratase [Bacteroidales bacterium]|nr:bifunctional UDP-3-O-[3-hydroxymyristoyl] N-acetylglucosamine deacetylase/3-hydroxyacyl-ACP dehydratase [Bacteroidales bacterium]